MIARILGMVSILLAVVLYACTPKTTDQAQSSQGETEETKTVKKDDPCAKFSDVAESALDAHVIYRDYIKAERYKEAFPYWRTAFGMAPAADGKRKTHYDDGIKLYQHMLEKQSSDAQKQIYLDSILYMYERMDQCYAEGGYVDGRIAFDLYYKYRDLTSDQKIFEYFTRALDKDGVENARAFVINPFTALLADMYKNDAVDQATALKYAEMIMAITEKHDTDKEEGWPIVVNYAPKRLEIFETVKGFYDCRYYVDKYYRQVSLDSIDCEEVFLIRSRLRWGECSGESDPILTLDSVYGQRCFTTPVGTGPLSKARDALEEGNYQEAISHYEEYIEASDDDERKGKYSLRIAKIYYAHLKNFARARQYARKASQFRPDWGEPYLVIGKLYASSGPLCGPGRGWDSQIVTWPAIDKFYQAKRVDPSVSAEANRLIRTYSKYMPSVEDIFQRQLQEGATFKVGCWIQETTTIRAARDS